MKKYLLILGVATLIISSCSSNNSEQVEPIMNAETSLSDEELLQKGDEITNEMQAVLMQNVQAAMKKGGPEYAVDFCNVNAIPLTDSISMVKKSRIQRLTDKNRNPNNTIQTTTDEDAWKHFQTSSKPYLASEEGKHYYYKPIQLGMPTCLKCHGTKDDISEGTAKIIAEKYPNDKATGYHQGDLRGMWKVLID